MSQMTGMDVAEVRALSRSLDHAGQRFVSCAHQITQALSGNAWQGRDATGFRQRWVTDKRLLIDVGDGLKGRAKILRAEADEQERASSLGGTITGLPRSGPGLPSGPVSGNTWLDTLGDAWETVASGVGALFDQVAEGAQDLLDTAEDLAGDALDWLEWLAGPDSPSLADLTALVPGLQEAIGDAADFLMQNPLLAPISALVTAGFGFTYVPEGDYYTTTENSIQSILGFADVYDQIHKAGGMDLDDEVVEFTGEDGTSYRLEFWKGEYMSGGAYGGEIGLYTRSPETGLQGLLQNTFPSFFSSADGSDQMRMTQSIYNTETGEVYFTNDNQGSSDGDHYWNLAIQTGEGVPKEQLGQMGTLYPNENQHDALVAALRAKGLEVTENADGSVSYKWE